MTTAEETTTAAEAITAAVEMTTAAETTTAAAGILPVAAKIILPEAKKKVLFIRLSRPESPRKQENKNRKCADAQGMPQMC
jgi:hypothetical protein